MLEDTRTFGYGKIAALDVFATAASATLLYIGGHFFARKQEERKERREELKSGKSEGLVFAADAAGAIAKHANGPSMHIAGTKQHEGLTRDAVLTQQL